MRSAIAAFCEDINTEILTEGTINKNKSINYEEKKKEGRVKSTEKNLFVISPVSFFINRKNRQFVAFKEFDNTVYPEYLTS